MKYHLPTFRDHGTYVKYITKLITLRYNILYPYKAIPESELPMIWEGAALHDLGQITIPDDLRDKPGPLSDDEMKIMRQHPIMGTKVVDRMAELCALRERDRQILHNIVLYHHERFDGSGYPEGLKQNEIPLEAQLVSVVEAYAGLTSMNYSPVRTHEEAMTAILGGELGAFNPEIVECLRQVDIDLRLMSEFSSNRERLMLMESTYGSGKRNYWRVKRIFDVVASGLGLLVISPLLLLIALIIWIDDPHGSPIFKQTRLGRHKKPFTMYKFRTMRVNAEAMRKELEALNEKDGPVFKMANDPRITRVGKILRKTSLDELPQLFNVLKGDMSLVGPRPPLPDEVAQYSRYSEMRLSVTPGLTCIWQVQPQRDNIRFDDWVDLDVAYIGTRSMRQDIKIIFMTILTIFKRSGQ